jgi:hypothetical protein
MRRPELTGVSGVPECHLDPAVLARLPGEAAPAPWDLECRAVLWLGRGGRSAALALPLGLRGSRALAVVGGMVGYTATPVGEYAEVTGVVVTHDRLRPVAHVAFMAVDSPASVVGGRVSWALPKTLATFEGAAGGTTTAVGGGPARWRVRVTPTAIGPRVPVHGRLSVRQLFPGGRIGDSRLTGRATARLAAVRVEVESDGPLPTWLRPGRHLGVLLEAVEAALAAPELR